MSRKVTEIEPVIIASPKYLARFGALKRPSDLAQHRCIVFTAPGRGRWSFKAEDGGVEHVDVPATFASDSLQCILQLALQGAGVAKLADFLVAEAVRAGDLVPLLSNQHYIERATVFAVFAPGTQKIPRCGVFSISWWSSSSIGPGGSARDDGRGSIRVGADVSCGVG